MSKYINFEERKKEIRSLPVDPQTAAFLERLIDDIETEVLNIHDTKADKTVASGTFTTVTVENGIVTEGV